MKQIFLVNNERYEAEIFASEKQCAVNGRMLSYEKTPSGLILDGKHISCECVRDETGKVSAVLIRGKSIPVETSREGPAARIKEPRREVRAPLNGQVVSLKASPQQRVKEGDVLLTLEAMKMENEIAAPVSGIIGEIRVKEKDVVKAKQLLFKIEVEP